MSDSAYPGLPLEHRICSVRDGDTTDYGTPIGSTRLKVQPRKSTNMNEIVGRLRKYVATDSDRYAKDGAMLIAADEIARLQNEILDWQRTTRAHEERNHELQSKVTSLSLELLTLHGESLGLYDLDNLQDLKDKNKFLNEEINMWKKMIEGLDNHNLKLTLLLNKVYKFIVGHGPDFNVFEDWEEAIESYIEER